MKTFTYTITDPVGIHARPAGTLAKKAAEFQSKVSLTKGEKTVELKRMMAVMGLGIRCGETVTFSVEGPDENEAAAALEARLHELPL